MTGEQGAINHLLAGDVGTALNDVETSLKNLFSNEVVPALKTFISTFATAFGSQALAQGAPLAGQVIAGTITIQQAGATLVSQLGTDALQDGENAAETALNAIRVNMVAQTAATTAPVSP